MAKKIFKGSCFSIASLDDMLLIGGKDKSNKKACYTLNVYEDNEYKEPT